MRIGKAKFERVIEEAKANDAKWLRAMGRAAEGILSGELIVTTLRNVALVTSKSGGHMANGTCECRAAQRGHKERYHRASARLIEHYETAAPPSPAPRASSAASGATTPARGTPLSKLTDGWSNRAKVCR
jgi:hypothetical protein